MDTDLDIRDMLLEVEADLSEIVSDVLKELALPQMKQALRVRWMTLPDEAKQQLLDENPELYKQIMTMIGGNL